jgi:hypothetical protein
MNDVVYEKYKVTFMYKPILQRMRECVEYYDIQGDVSTKVTEAIIHNKLLRRYPNADILLIEKSV